MGHSFNTSCLDCGFEFVESEGGGLYFHQFRCDTCGNTESVSHFELGDTFLQYLKGLPGSYSVATSDRDKSIKETFPLEPLTPMEFYETVSKYLGKCKCGGTFLETAPVRCPQCFSLHIQQGDTLAHYD